MHANPAFRLLIITLLSLLTCLPVQAQNDTSKAQDKTSQTQKDTSKTATTRDSTVHNIGEATVTATRLVFVMKKDTVVYDMDALAASQGDMLADVIGKMPGLELRDGVLYFKGRAVNRVLVNGSDFVRGDTQQALNNLPAYIIKSVKAYEGKTDIAKITGIDDGEKEQVVDIILRREYMGTWTGNAQAGGGTDERWLLRGFGNTFTDKARASVFGGFTNTAQYQSVSTSGDWGENGGIGSSLGDTRYMMPGFSTQWKNRVQEQGKGFFKLEFGGNWDYNRHNDRTRSEGEQYLSDYTSYYTMTRNHEIRHSKTLNTRLYLTWKPTETTHIEFGPNYSYNTYDTRSRRDAGRWNVPVAGTAVSPLDSLLKYAAGWPEGGAQNLEREASYSDNQQHNYSHWFYVTQKLSANNWRLSLRNQLSASRNHRDEYELTEYRYYRTDAPMDPLYNRYTYTRLHNLNLMNFVDLNVPLKFFETMRLTYGYSTAQNSDRADGYRLERLGGVFADYDQYLMQMGLLPSEADWREIARDADITHHTTTDNRKHWAEGYLQYNRKKLYASLQLLTRFRYDELFYWKYGYEPRTPKRHSNEYVVHTQWRVTTDSIGTFDLRYYYEKTPQSLSNAIDIPDNSDPLYIYLGNPDMKARIDHRVTLKYDKTFHSKRMLSGNFRWQYSDRRVRFRRTYDKATGVTTEQPTAVNGNWDANFSLNFSTPLDKKQRFNCDIGGTYNYTHAPQFSIGTEGSSIPRLDKGHNLSGYMRLTAREGKFFGQLNGYARYQLTCSRDTRTQRHDYFYTDFGGMVQYTLPGDIELKSTVNCSYSSGGKTMVFNPWKTVWSIRADRSFLRDKNLALRLECHDLLNQKSNSFAFSDAGSRSSYWSYTIGRTIMLHVIYRFSTKKEK